jgi:hypothetical protein
VVRFTLDGQRRAALYDEDYRLRLAVGVGFDPPPALTSTMYWLNVSAKPTAAQKGSSAGFVPERQVGRHNIAHRPLG